MTNSLGYRNLKINSNPFPIPPLPAHLGAGQGRTRYYLKTMNPTTLKSAYTNNSWATRMAASVLPNYPSDKWKWHYEHGLFVKALAGIGAATGDECFEHFVQNWVNHFVTPQGDILTYDASELNLDQINSGKLLFPLYRRTGR